MYVGTSRTRYKLSCITLLSEDDCIELMEQREQKYNRNIFKSFAIAYNDNVLKIKE